MKVKKLFSLIMGSEYFSGFKATSKDLLTFFHFGQSELTRSTTYFVHVIS